MRRMPPRKAKRNRSATPDGGVEAAPDTTVEPLPELSRDDMAGVGFTLLAGLQYTRVVAPGDATSIGSGGVLSTLPTIAPSAALLAAPSPALLADPEAAGRTLTTPVRTADDDDTGSGFFVDWRLLQAMRDAHTDHLRRWKALAAAAEEMDPAPAPLQSGDECVGPSAVREVLGVLYERRQAADLLKTLAKAPPAQAWATLAAVADQGLQHVERTMTPFIASRGRS